MTNEFGGKTLLYNHVHIYQKFTNGSQWFEAVASLVPSLALSLSSAYWNFQSYLFVA